MPHLFEGFASAAAKILDCKKNLADERAGISSPKKESTTRAVSLVLSYERKNGQDQSKSHLLHQ